MVDRYRRAGDTGCSVPDRSISCKLSTFAMGVKLFSGVPANFFVVLSFSGGLIHTVGWCYPKATTRLNLLP